MPTGIRSNTSTAGSTCGRTSSTRSATKRASSTHPAKRSPTSSTTTESETSKPTGEGTPASVQALEARLAELEAAELRRRRLFRSLGRFAGAVTAGLLVFTAAVALTDPPDDELLDCETPALFCFHSNSPARASEINHNFQRVSADIAAQADALSETTDAIEAKIGPMGDGNVTIIGDLYLDGTLGDAADTVTVPGNLSVCDAEGQAIFGGAVVAYVVAVAE